MRAFARVLRAELLKLRRTLAFWMILVAPLVVLALNFAMFHERSTYYVKQNKPLWEPLMKNSFVFWAAMMLPLYATLQTALLAGLEHAEDRWRNLLAMPVPRVALFWAKLAIPVAMTAVSTAILCYGAVAAGFALRSLKPELPFPDPAPWGEAWRYAWAGTAASLLVVTLQHWASMRFRSIAVSMGFGIAMTVAGMMVMQSPRYGPWWPWSLPVQLLTAKADALAHAVAYSCLGALLVSVAATVEFVRREIRG